MFSNGYTHLPAEAGYHKIRLIVISILIYRERNLIVESYCKTLKTRKFE